MLNVKKYIHSTRMWQLPLKKTCSLLWKCFSRVAICVTVKCGRRVIVAPAVNGCGFAKLDGTDRELVGEVCAFCLFLHC